MHKMSEYPKLPNYLTDKERMNRIINKINLGKFLLCDHCRKVCREYYLVKASVWSKAGLGYFGRLHRKCLEKRIGRPLVEDDYLTEDYSDALEKLRTREDIKNLVETNDIQGMLTKKIGCIETRGEIFTFFLDEASEQK